MKKLLFIFLGLIALVLIATVPVVLGFGQPFGGRILTKYECPCSFNYQVFIGPPMGGSFTMDSGTTMYSNNNPEPPSWSLGLADGYAPCLEYATFGCVPIGPGGSRIRMLGTS